LRLEIYLGKFGIQIEELWMWYC